MVGHDTARGAGEFAWISRLRGSEPSFHHRLSMDFAINIAQSNSVQHDQFGQEVSMKLPEDICLKIEKSADKEDILLLLARLESDGWR